MNEEYYEPLPDADAYLARIGAERKAPSVEYLDELVYLHQCGVPFENIDVYEYRRPVTLAVRPLYDKIVGRRRGGYCFELNGLFMSLLCALGFDAWSVPCRIVHDENPPQNPVMHRGNFVRIDGALYFCDVGFGGPMAPFAVPLDGSRKTLHGETFWMTQANDWWWMLRRITKGRADASGIGTNPETRDMRVPAPVMLVSPSKWEPVDFIELNRACSEGESARFARTRMINMRRPDGYHALNGNTLTVVRGDGRDDREIPDAEIPKVLKEYFGLERE